MITRRLFLGFAAGALIVPELIVPKRTFFLPPPGGWRPEDYTRTTRTITMPGAHAFQVGHELVFSDGSRQTVVAVGRQEITLAPGYGTRRDAALRSVERWMVS
jgi:hypothetical protein